MGRFNCIGQPRCEICRMKVRTSGLLILHYYRYHPKILLARQLLLQTLKNTVPKVLAKEKKTKTDTATAPQRKSLNANNDIKLQDKTKTVFAKDSLQILYRNNDIIIRDDKSSVDMEFSFDENSSEAKDTTGETIQSSFRSRKAQIDNPNNFETNNNVNKGTELKKLITWQNNATKLVVNASSSSASSEDSVKKFCFNKRIRKRRGLKGKTRHYNINIRRTKSNAALNESDGKFYECHCKEQEDLKNASSTTSLKLSSDTESASDTSKASSCDDAKVFCSKCGNGYKDEKLLGDHMKIHETHCRVCNEIFPTEQQFKEHIQTHMIKVFVCHICGYEFPLKVLLERHFDSHVESSVLESVLDMEEEYNITPPTRLPSLSYESSINNILCYLGANDTPYTYGRQSPKVLCDICRAEVLYSEYENHMQIVHRIYGCHK